MKKKEIVIRLLALSVFAIAGFLLVLAIINRDIIAVTYNVPTGDIVTVGTDNGYELIPLNTSFQLWVDDRDYIEGSFISIEEYEDMRNSAKTRNIKIIADSPDSFIYEQKSINLIENPQDTVSISGEQEINTTIAKMISSKTAVICHSKNNYSTIKEAYEALSFLIE